MQGRIPWVTLVVLLAASPVRAEAPRPVVPTPQEVRVDAPRPPDVAAPREEPPTARSIMRLPSLQTLQAVVNGRRLRPAGR